MKKIDKLKNSSVNRIAKKSANLSSNLPSLVLREQNAATLSTQLHYAERQLFVPDWISKRDTRTSLPPPPLIYDEAIEKSLLAFPPFYIRQLVLDATRFFRRLKVAASSTPSSPDILSSSTSSSVVRGGEETISRGASLRSAQVSLVDNAQREARVHDKLLARLTVLSVNEISCR